MQNVLRLPVIALTAAALLSPLTAAAQLNEPQPSAQPPIAETRIVWEVKNRFRLFRHEADFMRHVVADRRDGVLAAERRLAQASDGRGWARLMLNSLCIDNVGNVLGACERDGVSEPYLAPRDHRIGVGLADAPIGATCAWTFEQVDEPLVQAAKPCTDEIPLRVRYGAPTFASVEISRPGGAIETARTEILVRDLLIAGMGDSVASGEGNPDRPIALDDSGFCFRRVLGIAGSEYYRPSRAGFRGVRACEAASREHSAGADFLRRGADWMSPACHRSLYSYQLRTALALAVQHSHVSVTFVPLACTGAEIDEGMFKSRRAREIACRGRARRDCPATVPAQIPQAQAVLAGARRAQPDRTFDLILLTVGANDIHFSELVADVLLAPSRERALLESAGSIASVEDAQSKLLRQFPGAFMKLRAALKPLVGGDLDRVVYVSYFNPAQQAEGALCPAGRSGLDIHPAFNIDGERLRKAIDFVEAQFLPRLKALALCEGGVICRGEGERMRFVDAHQEPFRTHGFCAREESDPDFDRACFFADGSSFERNPREAAERTLRCSMSVRDFKAYAPRARWIRTPNDSYFAAMTYPDGFPSTMQPADIHDALWGVLSAVYGGAFHPTAEGHAAMADAALPEARDALRLIPPDAPLEVRPLPPPQRSDSPRN